MFNPMREALITAYLETMGDNDVPAEYARAMLSKIAHSLGARFEVVAMVENDLVRVDLVAL